MGPMPEILSHPNIPKPLHGLNPRNLMGRQWWDVTRRKVYAKYGLTCAACGVHKSQAKKHKWLEAHENFVIDYKAQTCRIVSIEPLCHYCHAFIHSGLLGVRAVKGEITADELREVLADGLSVLRQCNGTLFPGTAELCDLSKVDRAGLRLSSVSSAGGDWSSWKLLWGNRTWPAKYKSMREWERAYR